MSLITNNIAFVHIAKNAGRSISEALRKNGHIALENIPNMNGTGHCTSYEMALDQFNGFKFAVLRNPFDRFKSAYYSCLNDDEYNSIDECIDMIKEWEKSDIWKKGVWSFQQHACTDVPEGGLIFPRVPRAQYVPQNFYYDESITLYDFKNLSLLERDYFRAFRNRLLIGHIGKSNTSYPELTDKQKKQLSSIYAEDIEAYEKINML